MWEGNAEWHEGLGRLLLGGKDLPQILAVYPAGFLTEFACEKPAGKGANSDHVTLQPLQL